MPGAILVLAVGFLLLLVRILHLASQAVPPTLCYRESVLNNSILQRCSLLLDAYVPPLLWGKSGHLQTIIYGKMGRVNSPFPQGERHLVKLSDGATMSYDVFEPHIEHPSQGDYTLVICPGIANSSESLYICTCVHYAQNHGFRVAVLNHLGVPKNVPLTADRVFNYGSMEEYGTMVDGILMGYPGTQCIPVGFSMGGNVVLRWLGESKDNQAKVLAGMSFCQGYCAEDAATHLLSWEHFRRVYLYAMTMQQKSLLRRHRHILFSPEASARHGGFDEERVFAATSLLEIDTHYMAKRHGFPNAQEYYAWTSCKHYLHNIDLPLLIVNTMDDPIIPQELHHTPRDMALKHDNVIFATTQHGGHLGFFEGGNFTPDTITWLDKMVVQYANAVVDTVGKKTGKLAKKEGMKAENGTETNGVEIGAKVEENNLTKRVLLNVDNCAFVKSSACAGLGVKEMMM